MQSGVVFLALACMAPAAFFFSRNSSAYNHASMLALLAALALFGALAALALKGAFFLVRKARGLSGGKPFWWEDFARILVGVGVFGFLTQFSWSQSIGKGLPRVVFFTALTLACFFLARKAGKKFLNIFLGVFIAASFANQIIAESGDRKPSLGEALAGNADAGARESYAPLLRRGGRLQTTPNIYVLFLESFHNREYLQKAYQIDSPDFYEFLSRRGFAFPPGFIGSHSFTLSSALALLDLRIIGADGVVGHMDLRRDMRLSLCNNAVFEFLHEQGYRINVFDDSDYTFRFRSPYIDYANFYPDNMADDSVHLQVYDALDKMNSKLEFLRKSVSLPVDAFVEDYPGKYSLDGPNLFFMHFGANHSDANELVSPEAVDDWKSEYRDLYGKACENIVRVVEEIDKHDPSSLVVMLGDHGAYLYNYLWGPEAMAAMGLTPKAVALDYTSVFYAIRWPKGFTPHPEPADGLSTIRLFPYIVSNLQSAPIRQADYPPKNSYSFGGEVMVKNGEYLEQWEKAGR